MEHPVQTLAHSGFGGRVGSETSMSSHRCAGSPTLVGGRAGVGAARARARCKLELLLCSMAVITLSGAELGPKGLKQEL